MKVALAQMSMKEDTDVNLKKTLDLIKKAGRGNADLICFPEIHLSLFFPQYKNMEVHTHDRKYLTEIQKACQKYKIYAAPNLYFRENNQNYDMSFLIDDSGNICGNQKMVHVAQEEKFYEKSYYTPSDEGFNVFSTRFGKIGIVVCYDRHYPESIRTQAIKGAQLIIIPTANTSKEPGEMFKWEIKVQAFQNNVNIAMCNRCGVEDEMDFCGESIVADYNGNTIAIAGHTEELLFADVDLRVPKRNYIDLRRKELYL